VASAFLVMSVVNYYLINVKFNKRINSFQDRLDGLSDEISEAESRVRELTEGPKQDAFNIQMDVKALKVQMEGYIHKLKAVLESITKSRGE